VVWHCEVEPSLCSRSKDCLPLSYSRQLMHNYEMMANIITRAYYLANHMQQSSDDCCVLHS
jgi:hypothetical protein